MAGALVVHVAIIALLILVGFTPPEPSEEGGVPVMLGEVPDALGAADPSLVKVDVMPEETAPQVQETVEQDIITQETEETVAIKPQDRYDQQLQGLHLRRPDAVLRDRHLVGL